MFLLLQAQTAAKTICEVFEIIDEMSLDLDLWRVQNTYFSMTRNVGDGMRKQADSGDLDAKEWVKYFDKLGHYLKVRVF